MKGCCTYIVLVYCIAPAPALTLLQAVSLERCELERTSLTSFLLVSKKHLGSNVVKGGLVVGTVEGLERQKENE